MLVLDHENAQAGSPGNPATDDRRGPTLLVVVVALILVAALVGWMFHGFSLVRFVLPDIAATAPSNPAEAQSRPPSSAQQLYVWLTQFEAPLDALLVVRDDITAAAAHHDIGGVEQACESGQQALPRVAEHLPSPDPALNVALTQTLGNLGLGFSECLAGIRRQDPGGIELAAVYLYQANEDLRAAMAIIARDLADLEPNDSGAVPV